VQFINEVGRRSAAGLRGGFIFLLEMGFWDFGLKLLLSLVSGSRISAENTAKAVRPRLEGVQNPPGFALVVYLVRRCPRTQPLGAIFSVGTRILVESPAKPHTAMFFHCGNRSVMLDGLRRSPGTR
jgi:hypothetical protein